MTPPVILAAVSIAWGEQIAPWIVVIPVAVAVLALIHRWCRTDPDTWPVHHPKEGHHR